MEILEYDHVDPLQVLHLTLLALDFPFTPERAAQIRRTDPRPFPFFTLNAVENNQVLGQMGVFRLPMISIVGREEVGGIWAVSTHPQHSGRGIASVLLDESHARMRDAGLRFSTLGTDRFRSAYKLYQRNGYVDMHIWATAFAPWETAHQPTRLRAQPPGPDGYDFVESLFKNIAKEYLGFAWRHTPFARLRERVNLNDIRIVWKNSIPVGYVFTRKENALLNVNVQALCMGTDAAEVVAAVVSEFPVSYIQVTVSRPADIASLERVGYRLAYPTWGAFMVKPLVPELTLEDARRLFGFGTDRFLISWLDTT